MLFAFKYVFIIMHFILKRKEVCMDKNKYILILISIVEMFFLTAPHFTTEPNMKYTSVVIFTLILLERRGMRDL